MVSIFTMVHGREVIMMQWCLYFQWYNGTMVHGREVIMMQWCLYFQCTWKRGYNDAMVSIFSMVHGREVIMMQRCQWYRL